MPTPLDVEVFGVPETDDAAGRRDPHIRFRAVMPTEGPLAESGFEVWPPRIYDFVTQISREYDDPIIIRANRVLPRKNSPSSRGRLLMGPAFVEPD